MAIVRKRRKVTELSLVVSVVFHTVVIALLVFFAAREGYLGKQLKTIAVTMAPKEKPPEPEKPKEPEKKPEPPRETPKPEEPKPQLAATPPPTAPPRTTAPPPTTAPAVAPPAAALPSFSFSDGAKPVETTSDPVQLYKGFVEFSLRSKWLRPEGIADNAFVAEVEVNIDTTGRVTGSTWKSGSGNAAWDESVRRAVAQTTALSRPPPKNFPGTFLVRFDVVEEADINGAVLP